MVPPTIHSSDRKKGGPEGARTPDLIHAMDALFQLRYRPMYVLSYALILRDIGRPGKPWDFDLRRETHSVTFDLRRVQPTI